MERPKLLVFVRHPESLRNQQMEGGKIFISDFERKKSGLIPDYKIPLTPNGIEQAKKLGVVLKREFGIFDILIHSGYLRSKDATHYIFVSYTPEERKKIIVIQNILVRERDTGYTFFMTKEEVEKFFPFLQTHWNAQGPLFGIPPGGESLMMVTTRASIFLESLYRDYPDKKICVVSHGNFIKSIHGIIQELPFDEFLQEANKPFPNCCVTAYEFSGTRIPKCVIHNHVF
ncbi:MAG: hypothetical protein LiPW41_261 [Parcubacteria group bacterium LiPW_41]|nr:MAG: hypothetical protein LiPW41_261 [Parcubacteria group bacterium LiPW_41]